jgi:hypothetical protein
MELCGVLFSCSAGRSQLFLFVHPINLCERCFFLNGVEDQPGTYCVVQTLDLP